MDKELMEFIGVVLSCKLNPKSKSETKTYIVSVICGKDDIRTVFSSSKLVTKTTTGKDENEQEVELVSQTLQTGTAVKVTAESHKKDDKIFDRKGDPVLDENDEQRIFASDGLWAYGFETMSLELYSTLKGLGM